MQSADRPAILGLPGVSFLLTGWQYWDVHAPVRPSRVLLVEDDPTTRQVLEVALVGRGYDVRVECSAPEASRTADAFWPDLAVVGVDLQARHDGIRLMRALLARHDLFVMLLSRQDDLDTRLSAFASGVDDYMTSPFTVLELLARVQALLRRCPHAGDQARQFGDLVIDELVHQVRYGDAEVEVTPTEFRLLVALAREPGRIRSKDELLDEVSNEGLYAFGSVQAHVNSLRRKLDRNGPSLIHTVRGVGYVLRGAAPDGDRGRVVTSVAS